MTPILEVFRLVFVDLAIAGVKVSSAEICGDVMVVLARDEAGVVAKAGVVMFCDRFVCRGRQCSLLTMSRSQKA